VTVPVMIINDWSPRFISALLKEIVKVPPTSVRFENPRLVSAVLPSITKRPTLVKNEKPVSVI